MSKKTLITATLILAFGWVFSAAANAEYRQQSLQDFNQGAQFKSNSILLVGLSPNELSEAENQYLLEGKEIISIPYTNNWEESMRVHQTPQAILKQPDGYVGLYNSHGDLARTVSLNRPPNIPAYTDPPIPARQDYGYQGFDQLGYVSGGRRSALRQQDPFPANHQAPAAGWGYNKEVQQRGTGGKLLSFLTFLPNDPVTPFRYPGNYSAASVPAAYGIGALPHIPGFLSELTSARRHQKQYQSNLQQPPDYIERPINYHNPADPTNPITRDPNYIRMNPMPQAFNQNYPGYYKQTEHYDRTGQPLDIYQQSR